MFGGNYLGSGYPGEYSPKPVVLIGGIHGTGIATFEVTKTFGSGTVLSPSAIAYGGSASQKQKPVRKPKQIRIVGRGSSAFRVTKTFAIGHYVDPSRFIGRGLSSFGSGVRGVGEYTPPDIRGRGVSSLTLSEVLSRGRYNRSHWNQLEAEDLELEELLLTEV